MLVSNRSESVCCCCHRAKLCSCNSDRGTPAAAAAAPVVRFGSGCSSSSYGGATESISTATSHTGTRSEERAKQQAERLTNRRFHSFECALKRSANAQEYATASAAAAAGGGVLGAATLRLPVRWSVHTSCLLGRATGEMRNEGETRRATEEGRSRSHKMASTTRMHTHKRDSHSA